MTNRNKNTGKGWGDANTRITFRGAALLDDGRYCAMNESWALWGPFALAGDNLSLPAAVTMTSTVKGVGRSFQLQIQSATGCDIEPSRPGGNLYDIELNVQYAAGSTCELVSSPGEICNGAGVTVVISGLARDAENLYSGTNVGCGTSVQVKLHDNAYGADVLSVYMTYVAGGGAEQEYRLCFLTDREPLVLQEQDGSTYIMADSSQMFMVPV